MTTEDDLYAAVCASPEDDAPRSIMADWYDENGNPGRAEYIRLALRLAQIPMFNPHVGEHEPDAYGRPFSPTEMELTWETPNPEYVQIAEQMDRF